MKDLRGRTFAKGTTGRFMVADGHARDSREETKTSSRNLTVGKL